MNNRQIVHDILRDYPEARNSDEKVLEYYYIDYCNDIDEDTWHFIENHYSFIAIHRRDRRYWQNTKGLFPPTEEVKKGRRKKQAEIVQKVREEKQSFAGNVWNYARRIFDNK